MVINMPLKRIKEIFNTACLYFTALVFLLYVSGSLLIEQGLALTLPSLAMVFAFSALMAIAGLIWKAPKISSLLKYILHYLCFIFSFWGVFILIGGYAKSSSAAFIVIVLISLLYIISAIISLIVKNTVNRKKEKKSGYTPVYKSADGR